MWEFTLHVDRGRERTLFMQLANAIVEDIRRGRLLPGDRLPGTRTLAGKMGVNRVTVSAAYDELAAEGWIVTHPARGTFVAAEPPPGPSGRPHAVESAGLGEPAYVLPPGPSPTRWLQPARGVLMLRSNCPDTRLVRVDPLARAYRRVLRRSGGSLLGYGDPEGLLRLRRAIAEMLRGTRALAASAENVLVTRGSQMAIALAGRALLRPGDTVVVEEPGYRHAWDAFAQSGAGIVAVPVDRGGLDVDALARVAVRTRVRAVFVTPHHQLPTTVTLEQGRRRKLLELAHVHGFAIVEDDFDHEFHFDGRPVTPLASADPSVVIYIGSFSKTFAPGLRIGYLVAPSSVVRQLAACRQAIDMQGDPALEAALAELIEDEEIQRHVRRVKRVYQARRDVLVDALERRLGDAVSFAVPAGGLGLWIRVASGIDADRWAAASYRLGAAFLTGRAFTVENRYRPFARLGYASLDEQEIRQAVDRLAAALPEGRVARTKNTA
jgi:GntR family transcriptional regulator/MocR family aminotransferase